MKNWIFLLLILAASCKKGDHAGCFSGTGDVKTEVRTLENFSSITLNDNINVILIQGTENKVEVEAGENLIRGISTKIENGDLKITNENTCNFMRSYKIPVNVYVTYNSLRLLTHYGAGKVSNQDTIRQSYFEIRQYNGSGNFELNVNTDSLLAVLHTGSGNLTAKGKSDYVYLYSSGNSIFYCKDLIGTTMHINNNTTGNFYVNPVNSLLVEVYSASTTYYKGSPALTIFQVGTGTVVPF